MSDPNLLLTLENIKENTSKVPNKKFKIFGKIFNSPLFSGDQKDHNGNNVAWCAPDSKYSSSTGKEDFYIIRTGITSFGNEEFKIKNVAHNAFLQMDAKTDGTDRYVTLSTTEDGKPEQTWYIVNADNDKEFKIFNKKFCGPLFCGTGKDGCGDHWAWVNADFQYENKGKERWFIRFSGQVSSSKEVSPQTGSVSTAMGNYFGAVDDERTAKKNAKDAGFSFMVKEEHVMFKGEKVVDRKEFFKAYWEDDDDYVYYDCDSIFLVDGRVGVKGLMCEVGADRPGMSYFGYYNEYVGKFDGTTFKKE